jgi:aconitate hydratase
VVGFGCITCIGNSGPLIEKQSEAINKNNLDVVAVLSGNRNYEARIHRDVRANYLMSPPLLIAFAIAGTVLKDITKEPLGTGKGGKKVYLKDIWPTGEEIRAAMAASIDRNMFVKEYGKGIHDVNPYWNKISGFGGELFAWNPESTYIALPPFFKEVQNGKGDIKNARVLAVLGDSISTDHISPAGAIAPESPAGKYLSSSGVRPSDFNTYGSRRGNHEVMVRGTFANNRLLNGLAGGKEGGFTVHFPDGRPMTIFDAAMQYKNEGVPLVVIAGREYGSGSSRDWAAKGPMLLGVRAIIAQGYERIHKSNLIGMGILPLQFEDGKSAESLKIDFSKPISIEMPERLSPGGKARMSFVSRSGKAVETVLKSRIDTAVELEYYKAGGILRYVAGKIMGKKGGHD